MNEYLRPIFPGRIFGNVSTQAFLIYAVISDESYSHGECARSSLKGIFWDIDDEACFKAIDELIEKDFIKFIDGNPERLVICN